MAGIAGGKEVCVSKDDLPNLGSGPPFVAGSAWDDSRLLRPRACWAFLSSLRLQAQM